MRSLFKIIASFVIITAGLMAGDGHAADVEPPKIDRFRAYLLWEETGDLSKDVAKQSDIDSFIKDDATGQIKQSEQMLIDVVIKAKPLSSYDKGVQPFLNIVVKESADAPPTVNVTFPFLSFPDNGQLVRTVVVEHKCSGFTVKASVVKGDKTVSEMTKEFIVSCGD